MTAFVSSSTCRSPPVKPAAPNWPNAATNVLTSAGELAIVAARLGTSPKAC